MSQSESRTNRAKPGSKPLFIKSKKIPFNLKDGLFYAIALLFFGWCFIALRSDLSRISVEPIWQARNAVLCALLLSLLNYFLRAVRWSIYLKRFGFHFPARFIGLSYVAGFAFTLSPGKIGEMVRARYYKEAGVPLNVTTASFFVERVMDTLAMVCLALFGYAIASGYGLFLWISFAVMLGILALLAFTPWSAYQIKLARHSYIPATLINTAQSIVKTMTSARTLLGPSLLASGFLIGLLAWGAEASGLMLLGGLAPSVPMEWATACGIYAIAILVGAVSFLPGGLGSTEVVMVTLLAAHGYPMPQAILITMVCRFITLWLAVVIGWGSVLVLRHYPEQVSITS